MSCNQTVPKSSNGQFGHNSQRFCSISVNPLIINHPATQTSTILCMIKHVSDLHGTMHTNKDYITPNHKHAIKYNKLSNLNYDIIFSSSLSCKHSFCLASQILSCLIFYIFYHLLSLNKDIRSNGQYEWSTHKWIHQKKKETQCVWVTI